MNWFRGPIPRILGIPTFWLTRVGALLQFLAALYILVELVGKERIEAAGKAQASWLRAAAKKLRDMTLGAAVIAMIFSILARLLHPKELRKVPVRLVLLALLVTQAILSLVLLPRYWWLIAVPIIGVLLCLNELVNVLLLGGATFFLAIPALLAAVVVEKVTSGIVGLLEARPASRALLILSVCLLLLGFVMQMASQ